MTKSALLFLVLALSFQVFSQNFPRGIELITPLNSSEIQKLEKVEWGISLSTDLVQKVDNFINNADVPALEKRNPFVSWSLRYWAVFTHESGRVVHRDGFYFQDYNRQVRLNRWLTSKSNFPFRIRVAFPLAGKWKAEFFVFEEGGQPQSLGSSELFVQDSNRKDFVSVHPNKRNLQRGSEMIYPVGANLFSPVVNNNLYYSLNPKESLQVSSWDQYHRDLKSYIDKGGKYIRFIMEPTASEIEFEEVGNYSSRLNLAWEMDQVLQTAELNDVSIEWNCMIQSPFKVFDREFPSWDFMQEKEEKRLGYGYSSRFNLKKPSEIFSHPEAWSYLKERYRYIFARWGYSPAISFFELLSEPFWLDQDDRAGFTPYDTEASPSPTRTAVAKFHYEMARYIKEDLKQTQLLAALGHVPELSNPLFPSGKGQEDNSWASPHIDVITMNMYTGHPAHLHLSSNNILSKRLMNLQTHYQKPLVFSETQTSEALANCSKHATLPIDLMSTAFSGISGFYIWEVFYYDQNPLVFDDRSTWEGLINTQNFLNQNLLKVLSEGNGSWTVHSQVETKRVDSGGKKENVLGVHWYCSVSGKKSLGVIINRTSNVYTNRSSDEGECTSIKNNIVGSKQQFAEKHNVGEKDNKLTITGLAPKQEFRIQYYGLNSSTALSTETVKSNRKGKVKLHFPVLKVTEEKDSQPAVWFVIE